MPRSRTSVTTTGSTSSLDRPACSTNIQDYASRKTSLPSMPGQQVARLKSSDSRTRKQSFPVRKVSQIGQIFQRLTSSDQKMSDINHAMELARGPGLRLTKTSINSKMLNPTFSSTKGDEKPNADSNANPRTLSTTVQSQIAEQLSRLPELGLDHQHSTTTVSIRATPVPRQRSAQAVPGQLRPKSRVIRIVRPDHSQVMHISGCDSLGCLPDDEDSWQPSPWLLSAGQFDPSIPCAADSRIHDVESSEKSPSNGLNSRSKKTSNSTRPQVPTGAVETNYPLSVHSLSNSCPSLQTDPWSLSNGNKQWRARVQVSSESVPSLHLGGIPFIVDKRWDSAAESHTRNYDSYE